MRLRLRGVVGERPAHLPVHAAPPRESHHLRVRGARDGHEGQAGADRGGLGDQPLVLEDLRHPGSHLELARGEVVEEVPLRPRRIAPIPALPALPALPEGLLVVHHREQALLRLVRPHHRIHARNCLERGGNVASPILLDGTFQDCPALFFLEFLQGLRRDLHAREDPLIIDPPLFEEDLHPRLVGSLRHPRQDQVHRRHRLRRHLRCLM
mmetsp:Transcript_1813/g.4209  ORF Transcript_1813/g.4209 Transcript_1813/m.4209 type:complete len:210 (+) Transcript_1813:1080-1709(+)